MFPKIITKRALSLPELHSQFTLMIFFFLAFQHIQNHAQCMAIEQEEGCCVPYFIISSIQLLEQ